MSFASIRARLEAARLAKPPEPQIDFSDAPDIDASPVVYDYDTSPRDTVKALLRCPREEEFTFKCERFGGDHYVGAMRSVLSRARKDLKRAGKRPREFKLFLVSITTTPTHDLVTVLRTEKHRSLLHKSVYDEMMGELADEL